MEPSLQLTAALEQAAESGSDIAGSTWDIVRAFDSVSKPVLYLIAIRIGIPMDWAKYLVSIDADSKHIIRTPWAEHCMRHNGRSRFTTHVRHLKTNETILLPTLRHPTYFHAIRGVGQGDVGSPSLWNRLMDVLLCALDKINLYPYYC